MHRAVGLGAALASALALAGCAGAPSGTQPATQPTSPPFGGPQVSASPPAGPVAQPTMPGAPGAPSPVVPATQPSPVAPPQAGLPTVWPAPPATPEPTGYAPLVGRWHQQDDFSTRVITFLPDGRYGETLTIGDADVSESGVYSADGSTVVFMPIGAEASTWSMSVEGETLVLVDSSGATTIEYTLEPGSPEAVIGEAAAQDAQEAQLDAQWRARLPVARMTQQPVHIPVGEVPADPNVSNVFLDATVFVSANLYVDISMVDITLDNGTTQAVQNTTNWHFLPTGRVFTIFTNWSPGRIYDSSNPQPDVATHWGAYTVVEGVPADRLLVQSDAGEQIEMQLTHGRRNLIWGNSVYGQVDWENEQLQ